MRSRIGGGRSPAPSAVAQANATVSTAGLLHARVSSCWGYLCKTVNRAMAALRCRLGSPSKLSQGETALNTAFCRSHDRNWNAMSRSGTSPITSSCQVRGDLESTDHVTAVHPGRQRDQRAGDGENQEQARPQVPVFVEFCRRQPEKLAGSAVAGRLTIEGRGE